MQSQEEQEERKGDRTRGGDPPFEDMPCVRLLSKGNYICYFIQS